MRAIRSVAARLRSSALGNVNSRIIRRFSRELDERRIPTFIVVTPHLVHLAPLAARNHPERIQPVFVANGLSENDREWLTSIAPEVPTLSLRASLRRQSASMIEHGVVINYLAESGDNVFCIQDADCFISDAGFWDSMELDEGAEYAAGPFLRHAGNDRPEFPETFLLMLNRRLMQKYMGSHGITAETTPTPRRRAQQLLTEAGYGEGRYIETLKDYYDTLQQYWIASEHHGFRYRHVEGDGETVHHVGGSSYLYETFDDLEHWDYWPLNVQYLHLRLLELPACAPFRDRFSRLIQFHGSSAALLSNYPAFAAGWRRKRSDLIIDATGAEALYR